MRFAIYLLMILAAASLIGIYFSETMPASGVSEARLIEHFGPTKYRIFQALGLFNPYRSVWYRLLLGVLTLALVVCVVNRIGPTWRSICAAPWPGSLESLGRNQRSLRVDAGAEGIESGIGEYFRRRLFRSGFRRLDSGVMVGFAQRGDFRRFGSILMHLGLIAMVLGGLVTNLFGFTTHMWGREGDTLRPPGAPFQVRVDRFVVEKDERDRIKDYLCTLTVIEDGREIRTKVIEVNDPLRYGGYNFYQSDWRQQRAEGSWAFQVGVTGAGGLDTTLALPFRRRVPLGDGLHWVEVREYYPDFFIGGDRRPGTRSPDPNNPAIRIVVYRSGTDSAAASFAWAFQKFPDAHMGGSGDFTFRFVGDMTPVVNLTGLQVTRSPGSGLIWTGILFSTLGLMLAFFVPYRRYLFYIEPDKADGRWIVNVSGQRLRGVPLSRQELSGLLGAVSDRLAAGRKKEENEI